MGDSAVKIFAQEPQKKIEQIGSLCNNDYQLIRNRIIGHSKGGTKELVTELLLKAGWDEKRDARNVFDPVIETFMQIPNIDLKKLRCFAVGKEQHCFFQKYLECKKVFNLYEMFYKNLEGIYPKEGIKKLVDELWKISTCINQVGVGPGEICLSILTDARKGMKGDLLMTKVGDVEVKSTEGRLGSGKNALVATAKIRKFFEKKNIMDSDIGAITLKKPNWNWSQAVQFFFNYDWKFSNREIVDMFLELTTQSHSIDELQMLRRGINSFFTSKLKRDLQEPNRLKLAEIVIAIQLASYQYEHKFSHLLSVNKETKDAYSFCFPQKTLDKVVSSIYNQIKRVGRFNSYLRIDNTGTRKGIDLSLK